MIRLTALVILELIASVCEVKKKDEQSGGSSKLLVYLSREIKE